MGTADRDRLSARESPEGPSGDIADDAPGAASGNHPLFTAASRGNENPRLDANLWRVL